MNWNRPEETLACLEALRDLEYPHSFIVVVDNGSSDDSLTRIAAAFPAVTLVANDRNLGFAGGCNIGMRTVFAMGATFAWLLNSDARTEPHTLKRLVAYLEADVGLGLISPLLRPGTDADTTRSPGGIVDRNNGSYVACHDVDDMRVLLERVPTKVVAMGTALLVRKALFDSVGGLDEDLFAYWEDVDYGMRAATAGYRTGIDFGSWVYHPEKSVVDWTANVTPRYLYYMARNEILLWRKHLTGVVRARALYWSFRRQIRLLQGIRGRREPEAAVWAGIWHGWRGIGGAYDVNYRMPDLVRRVINVASALLFKSRG